MFVVCKRPLLETNTQKFHSDMSFIFVVSQGYFHTFTRFRCGQFSAVELRFPVVHRSALCHDEMKRLQQAVKCVRRLPSNNEVCCVPEEVSVFLVFTAVSSCHVTWKLNLVPLALSNECQLQS